MSEETIREIFAKNLRHYLDLNNKSQTDLSNYLGVSTAIVSNWYSGKKMPRVDKIKAIAEWLGLEMSDLSEDKANEPEYYYDQETRDLADFLCKNPDYKVLFDASRKVKREDIDFVKKMIEKMGGTDG